ncbi:MAG: M28 family peptidase [Calditrichae bacterium]|nr:M28 family peptidase [Calditrichota bacterium]MCB9058781.1 M28 family peptidase [Calditrichia bacterium]
MKRKSTITLIFAILLLLSCAKEVPQFDAEKSFSYLEKQLEFGPRNPGSTGHKACAEWLVKEFKNNADRVLTQDFEYQDTIKDTVIQMTNIVASFNLKSGNRILLCAHWDTRPFADRDTPENQNTPIPGANDGASGVAVLLEIARQMHMAKPEIGVDIVLFDGEDYGHEGQIEKYFIGSRYFSENLKGYKPRYGILLDMVGDAQLNLPIEYQSQRYAPRIVDKVWSAAEKLSYAQFERRIGAAVNDDHIQLNKAGIPTIDIIDFEYPDSGHKYWHTLQDTADKCSPQSLKAVGQTLLYVLYNEEG